jgi:hypothetical protein
MEWSERRGAAFSKIQPPPFRKLMRYSWRRPFIGSVLQGLTFGVLFSALILLTHGGSTFFLWQTFAITAPLFALGMYPVNRWHHNRPERFLADNSPH